MNPIDIRDLALNLNDLIGNDGPGRVRYPLLVTRDGEPEAVIIRHKAYAPRLKNFGMRQDGDLYCTLCPGQVISLSNPYNLDDGLDAANQHWRDTHRPTRA